MSKKVERISREAFETMLIDAGLLGIDKKSELADIIGVSSRTVRHWIDGDYTPSVEEHDTFRKFIAFINGQKPKAEMKKLESARGGSPISFVPNEQDLADLRWFMRYDGETNMSEILRQALHFYINARIERLHALEREADDGE